MTRKSHRKAVLEQLRRRKDLLLRLTAVEEGMHDDALLLSLLQCRRLEALRYDARPHVYRNLVPDRDVRMNIVLSYKDKHFRQEARMSRACFDKLVGLIEGHPVFYNDGFKEQAPPFQQLLVTLFRLGKYGNGASIAHMVNIFSISDGTIENFTWRCILAIYDLRYRYLHWPDAAERKVISARIAHTHIFGSCVGMMDGSLIPFAQKPGLESAPDFWNRKHRYAYNIMAICDDTRRIRALQTGYPGAVNDQRVFDMSPFAILPQALRRDLLSPGEYVLADGGYTTMKHVITPYVRMPDQPLPLDQERWNYNLSRCRMTVEHAFGMLKGRFESLRGIPIQIDTNRDQHRAHLWIHTCAILHNFLVDEGKRDEFWEDRGGLAGMLAALDMLRKSTAKDRRRYERATGTCLDTLADREGVDETGRDDTMRQMIKMSAEARSYRPYYRDA